MRHGTHDHDWGRRSASPSRWVACWAAVFALACQRQAPLATEGARPAPSALATAPAGPTQGAEVAIVGGGLGGLVTAYALAKKGIRSHVLEMEPRLGGRVQTARYGQALVADYGMQEIWEGSPLVGIVRELGLALDGGGHGLSSVVLGSRLYAFGAQSSEEAYLRDLFSPPERTAFARWRQEANRLLALAAAEPRAEELAHLQTIPFTDWLKALKLPTKVASFLHITVGCEVATDLRTVSALSGLLSSRMFVRGERAFHVLGGNGKIIEALGRAVGQAKTLGARVTAVVRRSDGTYRVHYLFGNQQHTLDTKTVVVAVPWIRLHEIQFDPPLDAGRRDAIRGLGRGSYVVVHLRIDRQAAGLWGGAGHAPFPVLTDGPLGVIYGPVHAAAGREAGDEVIFSLLVWGFPAQAWHMSTHDEKLGDLKRELDKLWPGFSRFVHAASVYTYHPSAVAFWPPGRSPLDGASNLLREPDQGRYLVGDWLEGSHAEGAVVAALRVAAQIAEGPERH